VTGRCVHRRRLDELSCHRCEHWQEVVGVHVVALRPKLRERLGRLGTANFRCALADALGYLDEQADCVRSTSSMMKEEDKVHSDVA
jgi:hypothetical protein